MLGVNGDVKLLTETMKIKSERETRKRDTNKTVWELAKERQ